MKKNILILLLLLTTGLLKTPISGDSTTVEIDVENMNNPSNSIGTDIALPQGVPISINGNADFHAQAILNDWDRSGERSGNSSHPYTIQGFEFNGYGIDRIINISNTDVYFTFAFNTVHNTTGTALWMSDVFNADIRQNTIYNTGWAMFLRLSDSEISNNWIYDGYRGINILGARNIEIFGNEIFDMTGSAIVVEGGSNNNHIYHNNVHDSSIGMSLWSYGNLIHNNSFIMTDTSIIIDYGSTNSIRGNYFKNATQYFIKDDIGNNDISYNTFDGRPGSGNEFASRVTMSANNNFYSSLNASDADGDGFLDTTYTRDNITDNAPLTRQYNRNDFDFISRISTVHWSPLDLSWSDAFDNYNLGATYTLYFRDMFLDTQWIRLRDGFTNNSVLSFSDFSNLPAFRDIQIRIKSVSDGGSVSNLMSVPFQLHPGISADAPALSIELFADTAALTTIATLSWDIPISGSHPITSYNIYRAVDNDPFVLLSVVSDNTNASFSPHIAGANYSYFVAPVTAVSEGAPSNTVVFTGFDLIPPTLTVEPFTDGLNEISGLVLIKVTAEDNVGIESVELLIESDGILKTLVVEFTGTFEYELNTTEIADGEYNITITVQDTSLNELVRSYTIKINNADATTTTTTTTTTSGTPSTSDRTTTSDSSSTKDSSSSVDSTKSETTTAGNTTDASTDTPLVSLPVNFTAFFLGFVMIGTMAIRRRKLN